MTDLTENKESWQAEYHQTAASTPETPNKSSRWPSASLMVSAWPVLLMACVGLFVWLHYRHVESLKKLSRDHIRAMETDGLIAVCADEGRRQLFDAVKILREHPTMESKTAVLQKSQNLVTATEKVLNQAGYDSSLLFMADKLHKQSVFMHQMTKNHLSDRSMDELDAGRLEYLLSRSDTAEVYRISVNDVYFTLTQLRQEWIEEEISLLDRMHSWQKGLAIVCAMVIVLFWIARVRWSRKEKIMETGQAAATRQAEDNRQLLLGFVNNASSPMYVKDTQYNFLLANQKFADIWKATPEGLIGKQMSDFVKDEDSVKKSMLSDQEVILTGETITLPPISLHLPNGETRSFTNTKFPIFDAQGQVMAVGGISTDITELSNQKAQLENLLNELQEAYTKQKEAEQLLHEFCNRLPAHIQITDLDDQLIFTNEGGTERLKEEYETMEQALGKHLSEFIPDPALVRQALKGNAFVKNERKLLQQEECYTALDGNKRYLDVSKFPLYDSENKLKAVGAIVFDITPQKQKEQELERVISELKLTQREKERTTHLLQGFLDNASAPMFAKDLEGRYLLANEKKKLYLPFSHPPLLGTTHREAIADEKRSKISEEEDAAILREKRPIEYFDTIYSPDGVPRYYKTVKFPIYDEKGEMFAIGGLTADITETVEREKELTNLIADLQEEQQQRERNEQLLNSFLDNASVPMFVRDLEGRYILANKKEEEAIGVDQLRGKTVFEVMDDKQLAAKIVADDASVISEKQPKTFYDTFPDRLKGEQRHFNVIKFPINTKQGEVFAMGCIVTDITEHVGREEELKALHQLAEDALKFQELFLANMSHEIRTPLNGVIGLTNLLQMTTLSAEQEDYVKTLKIASNNLMALINDILDLSKIQAGKLNIEHVIFDTDDVFTSIRHTFEHEASRKGILFTTEIAEDVPEYLMGDPTRLTQVLINLIGNAIKFTERGFIRLKVGVMDRDAIAVNLEFKVQDSGIGIDKESLEKIFESFSQERQDTARRFGGTGLGLTICRELITLMGGEISVQSTLGEGTTFTFRLPYTVVDDAEALIKNKANGGNAAISKDMLPPLHCLIAEDNLINQKVAVQTLKLAGITADVAHNGAEALTKLKQKADYDFVLMDVHMPDMDGYEASRKIRSELRLTALPIIATTASALKGEQERCLEAGMNDYLSKPFTMDQLFGVIRAWVFHGKPEAVTGTQNHPDLKDAEHTDTAKEPVRIPDSEEVDDITDKDIVDGQIPAGEDAVLYSFETLEQMEDDGFMLEMLDMFFDRVPAYLEELSRLINKGDDWEAVSELAHKLKSSVGVLQVKDLWQRLSQIEISSKEGTDLDKLPELMDSCMDIFKKIKDPIQQYRDEVSAKVNGGKDDQ